MGTIVAKSAWFSKINWTQGVSLLASILVVFGIDLDPKTQVEIIAAIQALQAVTTWAFRTFGNNTVSPDLAGKTVTVVKP